jgi:tripartite-type tricarboxylate transporter receptor subunit TctC
MGQVAAGTVKLLAIADEERSRYLPEVRTLKECGYPVALPLLGSFCVVKKTPGRIVEILANATEEVVKRYSKEIQEELVRLDNVRTFYNSKQSLQLFRQDYQTTLHIVKEMAAHNPNP